MRRHFCPKGPSDTILKESASHHWPGECFEAQNSEERPPEVEKLRKSDFQKIPFLAKTSDFYQIFGSKPDLEQMKM